MIDPNTLIQIIPTCVLIIGAFIYFLGARFGDIQIIDSKPTNNYFTGTTFAIKNVFFPLSICIFLDWIYQTYLNFIKNIFVEIHQYHISIIIAIVIAIIIQCYHYKLVNEKIISFTKVLYDSEEKLKETVENTHPTRIFLFGVPFVEIFIIYFLLRFTNGFAAVLLSLILAFDVFVNLAIYNAFITNIYQRAEIILKNSIHPIKGTVIHYRKEYVTILVKDQGIRYINRDEINHITVDKKGLRVDVPPLLGFLIKK